jgi:hypothetical protein
MEDSQSSYAKKTFGMDLSHVAGKADFRRNGEGSKQRA